MHRELVVLVRAAAAGPAAGCGRAFSEVSSTSKLRKHHAPILALSLGHQNLDTRAEADLTSQPQLHRVLCCRG